MAKGDPQPGFRTASELRDPPAHVPRGADAIRVCQTCAQWTGHEMDDDGSYVCIPCSRRDVPACEQCGAPAAATVDGTDLCGTCGRAETEKSA